MAIKFDNKAPEWDNVGAEPDAELKKGGFLAGYKPPAAYFNWFFNRTYECVKELQEKLVSSLKSLAFKDKVGDDDITAVAANKVTQDSKHRMITDAERSTWNGKADASGGDVSEMTVKTLGTITTEFPVPVAGESTKTFLGKVKKFFEDTKNWMTGVCLIGQIVNNCVTNNAKLPLSAAQGKVLMDLYTVLNTNLSSKAGYEKNVYTGQQYVITYAGIDDRAYLNMQFVSEAPWKENNSTRAGYGFHNSGSNGGALYLDTDGRLKFVTSDTHTVYALDWHSL